MIAVLSDIHGNLEALEAVLADAADFDVRVVHCLGDIVTFGPDPIACLQYAMSWAVVLRSELDFAATGDATLSDVGIGPEARRSLASFRSLLARRQDGGALSRFLSVRPTHLVTADACYVHGSPRDPLREYAFPEDIHNPRKLDAVASHFDALCFCGRTHVPGVFHRSAGGGDWRFSSPADCDDRFPLSVSKVICNVGSVGQPRDSDPRAGYVLYSPNMIRFRRVDYDHQRTKRKLRGE